MDQDQLIQRCIERDRKAQYLFYKKYYSFFFGVCYRYVQEREKTMDLMNLGFAKVMLNLKKYDKSQVLEKWMKTIIINVVIDEFRKTKTYKEHITIYDQSALANMNEHATEPEYRGEILEAINEKLAQLPPVTRSVFNLYAIDGFKHKEIAVMLNIPEGTCHWHYSKAKQTLKEHLQRQFSM